MKTYFRLIIVLVLTISGFSSYSQNTWEYFYRLNEENSLRFDELILNIEEIKNGDIISTASRYYGYYNQNDNRSIIRLHNGNTGKVYKEIEYSIDTLSPQLDWIFYDKESEIFTIVGSAHYINVSEQYKRGYFLITRWDKDLNLLEETIYKLNPLNKNLYLWYFNGNYTSKGEYLIHCKYNENINNISRGNYEMQMLINKSGNIIHKNVFKDNGFTGQHSGILEDKKRNRYILLGTNTYYYNDSFVKIDSVYHNSVNDIINNNHTTALMFSPDMMVLSARIDNRHRGLAFLTPDLKYDKIVDLTTRIDPETIEGLLGRRSLDFKDTSSIYLVSQDWHLDYYTVSRVNSKLKPYWIKYFSENDTIGNSLWSMKATLDGGCVIAGNKGGRTEYSDIPHVQGAFMKKFDAEGNTVAVKETTKSSWDITVFPNPSQGDFKIEIGGNAQNAKLRIFDLQGKEVKVFDKLLSGTNHLNMYQLSQGMYIWKLEKDNKIIGSGKWVKK